MKKIVFLGIDIIILFVMLIIWFLICFMLGYASNSNYQLQVWTAYFIAIIIHFLIMFLLYRKFYLNDLNIWYLLFNIPLYFIAAWYFYNYS